MLKQVCIQVAYLGNVSESELLKYVCGCESVREKESDWLRLTATRSKRVEDIGPQFSHLTRLVRP